MGDWLLSIVKFIGSLLALLASFIDGIFHLLEMLPSSMTMVSSSIASMPSVLVAFATAAISVSVVYLIVGR